MSCGAMNCTSVTSTGNIQGSGLSVSDGSLSTPTIKFTDGPTTGLARSPGGSLILVSNGNAIAILSTTELYSNYPINCGTKSMTCGSINSGTITAGGSISCGTNSVTWSS